MKRIQRGFDNRAYLAARSMVEERLGWIPQAHLFFGADPVTAGLHEYRLTRDGRAYSSTAHCAYEFHTNDSFTSVIVPFPQDPWVYVHELGHALDAQLDFVPEFLPITQYAQTNRQEAFAEAFTAWVKPPEYAPTWLQDALHRDCPEAVHLFDSLRKPLEDAHSL